VKKCLQLLDPLLLFEGAISVACLGFFLFVCFGFYFFYSLALVGGFSYCISLGQNVSQLLNT